MPHIIIIIIMIYTEGNFIPHIIIIIIIMTCTEGNFMPHIIIIIMTYTEGKFHASHYYYNDLY